MSIATSVRRMPTPVDHDTLALAVETAERTGPCKDQIALLTATAFIYNERRPEGMPAISYTVARLRIGEWNIPHQTQPQIHAIRRTGK